ncbi:MAG: Type 1 glutamine amidotransferase-like domain-containing protein [Bacilli bacterium]|nr:Type 1 glutamine amidotransferase-like domain-containing protein [Bacilli bacterium]
MKNIILLSGPDKTKYFAKEISKEIKNNVTHPTNMVVIPADPNNYEKNDKQFKGNESVVGVFKTFKKIFPDINIVLLDNRVDSTSGLNKLKKADIIYLLGGNPFIQLEYLQKNNYSDTICSTNALVMGVSAGSMNLAVDSYYSKDEDYPESVIYKGLGIVDMTIDPHFDINNEEQVKEIKVNSKDRKIIGLPNDSAIIVSNNNIKYIGDIYLFENGELTN